MVELERQKAEALLAYLMSRPYAEVEAAVSWLRMAIAQAASEAAPPPAVPGDQPAEA